MSPAEREYQLIIPTRQPDLGNASGGKVILCANTTVTHRAAVFSLSRIL